MDYTLLTELLDQPYYPTDRFLPADLPDAALAVMEKKYLRGETPQEMFKRVASAVAEPLYKKLPEEIAEQFYHVFYNMMATRDFMPNSPTLMNAGRAFNQLAACFVVPVEDSMEGIFRGAIADMAMIQRTGGGTGFDFSGLRPKGSVVSSTMGESSGPISFMRAFNACTDTVKQGGARRGANMGMMRIDHPDIKEFITLKSDPAEMTNFNLSVAVTDKFMEALERNANYDLVHNNKIYGEANAREIWDLLGERAWASGEPGVVFIDQINKFNTLPGLGPIKATNPCGEQPLLDNEACNLGSVNVRNCMEEGRFLYEKLKVVSSLATVFLDCVIDAGSYPLEAITEQVLANRKIGLGLMGYADVCYMREVSYADSATLAESIMSTIDMAADETSTRLAEVFGSFPNIEHSVYYLRGEKKRNATLTTIAPTGTISIVAGASYGIEPFFALDYTKTLTDTGEKIRFVNEHIANFMTKYSFPEHLKLAVESYILTNGSAHGIYEHLVHGAGNKSSYLSLLEEVFVTAHDIAPSDHVRIQAAFQMHTDNAVSKTINFGNDVSIGEIQKIFRLAYQLNCKGITVYRDGSRSTQPMTINKADEKKEKKEQLRGAVAKAMKRPVQLTGVTRQIPTGCGMMLVTANTDENGKIFEVLMRAGASGGCSAYTDAVARLLSISLRHDVPISVLIDQLRSVRCDNFRYQSGKNQDLKGKSCPDVVGSFLQEMLDQNINVKVAIDDPKKDFTAGELIDAETMDTILKQAMLKTTGTEGEVCPECGKILLRAEGCLTCVCGFSRC